MTRQRRSFKLEEKLRIIREAGECGIAVTRKKYRLAHSVLLRWRNEYKNSMHLQDELINTIQLELKNSREENIRLKKIIADQVLELQIKNEIIQKINGPAYR